MPPNIFSMKSFDEGYARQEGFRKRSADANAAGRIAAGDYRGAAGEYANQGLAPQAADMMGAQNDMDQQQRQNQRQDAQDAMQNGEQAYKVLKTIAPSLSRIPEGQRLAAFQQRAALLTKLGVPADKIASATEADLTDANLRMLDETIDQHWQVKSGPGGAFVGYDDRDPKTTFTTLREPTQRPPPTGFRYTEDGELEIDPNYVAGRAKLSAATRAPRAAGGGSASNIPPPPAGWSPRH